MLFSPLAINTVDTVASPHSRGDGYEISIPEFEQTAISSYYESRA